MRCGIIDIGSNTIRAVIYDVGVTNYQEVLNEKSYAEIISYTENGNLSQEGVDKLIDTLAYFENLCQLLDCEEIFYFATSSLRNIHNQTAVLSAVEKSLGIKIEVISGCAEAYFDYIGLKDSIKLTEALGFDLGGGSGQIFYYKDDVLRKSVSHPIGCLRLYNSCVSGVFPNTKERNAIEKTVKNYLKDDGAFSLEKPDIIYGMGGTARALMKLHRKLLGVDKGSDNYILSLTDLYQLEETITDLGLNGLKILNRIIPERLCTIIPGLIIIKVIMKHIGVKKLCIIHQGIREGYLLENVINRKEDQHNEHRKQQYLCQS